MVIAIPLIGLHWDGQGVPDDLDEARWTIIGLRQTGQLKDRAGSDSSLSSNLELLLRTFSLDALLLIGCGREVRENVWDVYSQARPVTDALCLVGLLSAHSPGPARHVDPEPVLEARVAQPMHPLAFEGTQVHVAGHTSAAPWLGPRDNDKNRWSAGLLRDLISEMPQFVQDTLGTGSSSRRGAERLARAMSAIHSAARSVSSGQVIQHALSACEILVGHSSTPWKVRRKRMDVVLGEENEVLEEVVEARHAYVHDSVEPARNVLAHVSLAAAVHTWGVMHDLYEDSVSVEEAWKVLDICHEASGSTGNQLRPVRELCSALPAGARSRLHWVRKHLSGKEPNSYLQETVVKEMVNCPECGVLATREDLMREEESTWHLACPSCKNEWSAQHDPTLS